MKKLLYLVAAIVAVALSEVRGQPAPYNYQNCAAPGQIKSGVAGIVMPFVPFLPDSFQVRVEVNILNKRTSYSAVEYVDKPKNRAALRIIQNNTMDYMIFDDTNNQIIYDVNNNCYADMLSNDTNAPLFGMKTTANTSIPHIYSTSGTLSYALKNGMTYMGNATIRGIQTDHWLSCMFWPSLGANFTLHFYWSVPTWMDSVLFPQVPVRATVSGFALGSNVNTTMFHNFNHEYDYFDFRSRIWGDVDSVFETPKGKVCKNRKQTRKLPKLGGQYSYREEIVDTKDRLVTNYDIWYDYNNKLMRYDYRPQESLYPLYNMNPATEIHDYNTGIAYVIDRKVGNCSVIPLINSTFGNVLNVSNNSKNSRAQFFIQMKTPSSLFYLDNTYTYEGKRTIRGLPCDVFISQRTDFSVGGYTGFKSIFEFYFLDNDWTEINNGGDMTSTARDIPVRLDITTPISVGQNASYNFYNFDQENPSLNSFNVKTCFNDFSQMPFIITFAVSFDSTLTAFKDRFLNAAMDTLKRVGHIGKIRIQSPAFHIEPDQAYFVGTLVDLPPATAYFRKLGGVYQQFKNDKSLYVSSPFDCAAQCNGGTALPGCNSFDYCRSKNLCSLSAAHTEDGALLDSKGQCDHYSRMAQSPDMQYSMATVWRLIRNAVYSGAFQMDVSIGNSVVRTYKASSTQSNVIQNDKRQATPRK